MSFSSRSFSQRSVSQKTMSVYGGAGGYGTRISTSQMRSTPQANFSFAYANKPGAVHVSIPIARSRIGSSGPIFTHGLDIHVDYTEKAMLQNLNDRLASYLQKVSKLEKENEQLEKQIREWYSSKTVISNDYTGYLATIADLQDKILAASTLNAKIYLEIDNSKLAADDFKMKYETELGMRQTVEGDIAGLKRVMDELTMIRMDLESQYESLKTERVTMEKEHEEDISALRTQMSGQVDVKVDGPASLNLSEIIAQIRQDYEALIAKSRQEVEDWYNNKIKVEEKIVEDNSSTLAATQFEIKGLKSTLQTLQIELQSQLSMKSSLEATLLETQERFGAKLAGFQATILEMEAGKSELDANMANLQDNYGTLLDIKTRLEAELAEYRRLLDGEQDSRSSKQVITKTIVVEETVVDGKLVTSNKTVDVNNK